MLTFQDYINELKKGVFKKRVKIEWLRREDETPYEEFSADIMGGNLSISRQNGTRRSVSLKLKNIDGKYIPSEDGVWINQKFKLYLGLDINGEDYLIPQGVFVISDPVATSNFSETYIELNGIDKFSLLDGTLGGNLEGIYQIPLNTKIFDAINSILVLAKDKLPALLGDYFKTDKTPYTIRKEVGSATLGEILTDFAFMVSANIYYGDLGNLVFEEDIDDEIKGSIWDFTTDEFHYLGATNSYAFSKVYNKVVVIGANIDGNIATGMAENKNLQSNTRSQLIGVKIMPPVTDDNITTDDLAQQRAVYELKRVTGLQSSISIKCTPFFHFNVDEVITITDKNLKLDHEKHLIQSIDIDFSNSGTMTVSCIKSKELAF